MDSLLLFAANYTYFAGVIIFFCFWLIIFLKKRINRREMLLAGAMFGIAAVIISMKYALEDYWHPAYLLPGIPIEDFLYGFFFGGICTQVYFFFFKVREKSTKNHHPLFALLSVLISVLAFVFITGILKLNSIVAHIAPPFFIGLYIDYKNYKNLKIQFWSGIFAGVITALVFKILLLLNPNFIEQVYYLNNITGILIAGIPLEEYLFAFSLGFGVSLFYEYATGREIVFKS